MERILFCIMFVALCCVLTGVPVDGVRCYACTGTAEITKGCADPFDANYPGVEVKPDCQKCFKTVSDGGVGRGCLPPDTPFDNKCATDGGIKRCACDTDLCNAASSKYYASSLLSIGIVLFIFLIQKLA